MLQEQNVIFNCSFICEDCLNDLDTILLFLNLIIALGPEIFTFQLFMSL